MSAEYDDEDVPPKEIPAHDRDCLCDVCWYQGRGANRCGSGRCGRCNAPIDDHRKDEHGTVVRCPRKVSK